MYTQSFTHMACIVALWFLSFCLTGFQKRLELDIDENTTTPSDYAVYLRNIPLNQDQKEVKQWCQNEWGQDGLEISHINMIYDVGDLVNAQRQLHSWRTKESLWQVQRENNRQDLIEKNVPEDQIKDYEIAPTTRKCCCCKNRVNEKEIQEKIDKYRAEIGRFYENLEVYQGEHLTIGRAFVVFKYQRDMKILE